MGRLFGTDGVRGIANSELTAEIAFKLGQAGVRALHRDDTQPTILIGRDTRISGDLLEDALSAGILSVGGNVVKAGVLPTPAVAYLVRHFGYDAGAVLSASHNPFEHNGIKFFNREGYKLDDEIELEIERLIKEGADLTDGITGAQLGCVLFPEEDVQSLYIEFLKQAIDVDIRDMNIVLDCANGAASYIAPRLFRGLGARVHVIHDAPDGININEKCGSTYPEDLQEAVRARGASVGLAFDGDADRLIAVDEQGNVVDGDRIMYICANMLMEAGELAGKRVATTIMSNLGFHRAIEALGLAVDVTQVGDRYVLARMMETGGVFGGEQSGHLIFRHHIATGDGILSALQLLQAMKRDGRPLSAMAGDVMLYPQVLKNASVKNDSKRQLAQDPDIAEAIRHAEEKLQGDGRIVIRPSGTEPLVRVMIEGAHLGVITDLAESLAALITTKLG